MGITQVPASFLKRFTALEDTVKTLRKRSTLNNSAISTGTMTLADIGQLILKAGAFGSSMIFSGGAFPAITMLPSHNPGNPSTITAVDDGDQTAIVLRSGIDTDTTTRTQLSLIGSAASLSTVATNVITPVGGSVTNIGTDSAQIYHFGPDSLPDGGFFEADQDAGFVGIQDDTGATDYFKFLAGTGAAYIGVWPLGATDANAGLLAGQSSAGSAGDTSHVNVYGPTMAGTMVPVACIADGNTHAQSVTAWSSTSFTLTWAGASSATYHVNYWAIRVS
jgi:hypothetical protein